MTLKRVLGLPDLQGLLLDLVLLDFEDEARIEVGVKRSLANLRLVVVVGAKSHLESVKRAVNAVNRPR